MEIVPLGRIGKNAWDLIFLKTRDLIFFGKIIWVIEV